jgi:hypothetical protein
MPSRIPPVVRYAAVSFVVAGVALAGCGSSSSRTATPTTGPTATSPTTSGTDELTPTSAPPTPATVTNGEATIDVRVGIDDFTTSKGTRVVSVPKGTNVKISLTAPGAQQYHLHGYDLEQEGAAGQTVTFELTVDQTGQFDLESHTTGDTMLVLVVQ